MTGSRQRKAGPRPDFADHTEDCTESRFIWQAALLPNLPRRGYCPDCGAVTIVDRNTPTTGTLPANERNTR